jgi:protein associated with RNAse G/E
MKPGDLIHVRACKADGTVYRSWHTTIESVDAELIVTISPAGGYAFDLARGHYFTQHVLRSYYWHEKNYNLIEAFDANERLVEIYLNIASPPRFDNDGISFTDHELDVTKIFPDAARLVDEDEFAEAAIQFQYTEEFKARMYAAAHEAIKLAEQWEARPFPDFGENHE